MRIKHLPLLILAVATLSVSAQTKKKKPALVVAPVTVEAPVVASEAPVSAELPRPKLVVGIVVDQMRWDYLYRYYSRYTNNGFKRLLNQGFSCENTQVDYVPTNTGPGHSCIYT